MLLWHDSGERTWEAVIGGARRRFRLRGSGPTMKAKSGGIEAMPLQ